MEHYQCTICSDVFAHPTSLLCGHTFCFECIFTWYIVHKNQQCPICRQDVNQIPTNCQLLLKSQIDLYFKDQPGKQEEYQERLKKGEEMMINVKEKEEEMKLVLEALANAPSSDDYSSYDDYSDYTDEDGDYYYSSFDDADGDQNDSPSFTGNEDAAELRRQRELHERYRAERKRRLLEKLRRARELERRYKRFPFRCFCCFKK